MFRSPLKGTVFTDHQPLVYFLKSSCLDRIYARWASELRLLNIDIVWIPGKKNEVADVLSRTIFTANNAVPELKNFGVMANEDESVKWIWKDGIDGYKELLKSIGEPIRERDLNSVFGVNTTENILNSRITEIAVSKKKPRENPEIIQQVYRNSAGASPMWGSSLISLGAASQKISLISLSSDGMRWFEKSETLAPNPKYCNSARYKDVSIYITRGVYT
ncbi:hypothetical protein K3495_g5855 [Podosphaera aphanis]|nr:hypothetical protein K3495_g5855 [Podosphaera aphanis]